MLFGKYINKYYLRYLWCYIIGIALLIAVDYLNTIQPELLGLVVKDLKLLSDTPNNIAILDEITYSGIKLIIVGLMMFVGRIGWRYSLFFAATRIEADLRKKMFEKAERLSPSYYHKNSVGTILNWFTSDLEEILEFFKWGTIQLIDAIFLSAIVLVKMFRLSWQLTLFILGPVLLIAIWSFLAEKLFTEKWKLRQESNDKLYEYSQESFTGIRVIKAFVKESVQIKAFAKLARENRDIDIGVSRFFILFERIVDLFIYILFGALLGLGGYAIYQSFNGGSFLGVTLEIDQLVTFIGYFDTLLWPIFAMGSVISMFARANACLHRITIFLDQPEDICQPIDAVKIDNCKGKVEFRHLNFRYPGMTFDHLKDINFTIKPGENIGVIGRIGCGKTTIANLICRLYNSPENHLFIDDVDIMKMDLKNLRDVIAYVPQDNFLFSDTVYNNIGFGKLDPTKEEIEGAAVFSDIDGDIKEFKNGYKTMVGERGTTLSGGQKQRISMARAYLKDAPIMIMDDSVSAVDVKTEESILNNIRENRKGKTTIIIASRISTVAKLDKVLVLYDGAVEAFDTPKNLLKTSRTYAKLHLLQELEKEKEGGLQ